MIVAGPCMSMLQDAAQDGCVDGGDVSGGKLRPQLNDQQLKALLTQGQAAQAKVRWCSFGAGCNLVSRALHITNDTRPSRVHFCRAAAGAALHGPRGAAVQQLG